jgi:nanoRNase/pAp phosphatase (c-di-AMP/oligoRNAs hydrolase)
MTPNPQLQALTTALTGLDRMLILPHNDPDPDAVASAVALQYLLQKCWQIECRIAYDGIAGPKTKRWSRI